MSRRPPERTPPKTTSRADEIRRIFDRYTNHPAYQALQRDMEANAKCLSDDGPWPDAERTARSQSGAERPCLHEDIISQFNNQVINQADMNPVGIDAQPEGDGADEKTAEEVENRIRQICYEQNEQHAVSNALACAVRLDIGYWELDTEWKSPDSWEQYICIKPILDPFTCVPDMDAKEPDWSDMNGFFKCWRLPHDELRLKFPNATIQDFSGFRSDDKTMSRWVDETTVQIAVFWSRRLRKRNLLALEDPADPDNPVSIFEHELKSRGMTRKGREVLLGEQRYRIIRESERFVPEVTKELTNGLEVLKKTDWPDEEIPVLVVNGRIAFQPSKGAGPGLKQIEGLTRKGRTAQMLYDHCISSIQEECGLVPKSTFLGYEGQFDTSTNWATITRVPTGYAEAKATTDEVGSEKPLPLPTIIQRRAQIDQLLLWKESILVSLQNALGMSSTERRDRSAKSGKALEQLQETMNVSTYHFYNSRNMAQVRQYRIMNRLLPKIENTARTVGFRNVKGEFEARQIEDNHYTAKHQIVLGSQKYYQSLQQEQADFAEQLLASVKDPMIMLAVLPGVIRMRGLGEFGDDLARMIEAIQPPPMQQARAEDDGAGDQTPMLQAALQQAQEAMQAVNAHAKKLEEQVIELEDEKQAKVVESQSREKIAEMDNATKIQLQEMKDRAELELRKLDLMIEQMRQQTALATSREKNATDTGRDAMKLEHADEQQDKQLIASALEAERGREHEKETASEKAD